MPIPLNAESIGRLSLHDSNKFHIQLGQTEERIRLISHWEIIEGEHILELGCGQGDCTAALASAVGEKGKVTAVDPAPLNYGAPWTLGEAQSHLMQSPIGNRMTFVESDPIAYLHSTTANFETAVLAHCIWYFASPSALRETFHALSKRVKRVCVAEWSLTTSNPAAFPHVLAALTEASLECRKPESVSNIRTVLSPNAIVKIAQEAGLVLEKESVDPTGAAMLDGSWEVGAVLHERFAQAIDAEVKDEREKGVIHALRDATKASNDRLGDGIELSSMDVWCAIFTIAD